MNKEKTQTNSRINRLIGQLAEEKKKTITAVCLISMMCFMWTRVLVNQGPETASAAFDTNKINQEKAVPEMKISFIELPNVKGRNDKLTRDFFSVNTESFNNASGMKIISKNSRNNYIKRVAEKLNLEAIGLGEKPQAFINNKLLFVGDILPVIDGAEVYECEVTRIERNAVFIKCGESEIQLKLSKLK